MLLQRAPNSVRESCAASIRRELWHAGIAFGLAIPAAWLWAVLLAGRALPWQADRKWAAAFVTGVALCGLWCWRFLRLASVSRSDRSKLPSALAVATGPLAVLPAVVVLFAYSSDQLNHLLARPYWVMPFIAGLLLVLVASETLQAAALAWLQDERVTLRCAVEYALASRSRWVFPGCLAAVAILQAAASVAPIGDDIWHYVKVADAFLRGLPYPTETLEAAARYPMDIMGHEYTSVGMARVYPALPLLPALIALFSILFGYSTVAVAAALAVSTALFPVGFYAACRSLTGSRAASYAATMLAYLFPIYQIHILGAPEPDALFIALLLLGAAAAARANRSTRLLDWLLMGVTMGLASLTRHEGVLYSAALFATFLPFHYAKRDYWLSVVTYFASLVPFAAIHYSSTGSLWPATFAGTLRWQNIEGNLTMLWWTSLNWYAQAIGVEKGALVALLALLVVAAMAGGAALCRKTPALCFIPLAGLGDIAMGMLVHPTVMQTASPVEFLRHISSGLAYTVLTLSYAAFVGFRLLSRRLSPPCRRVLLAAMVVLFCAGVLYETECLARPEWYFEGHASLLWTGSGYLLADVVERPVALPATGDPRTGEELRDQLGAPLDPVDLRKVNRSEPYHWTSLLVALFGLAYALVSEPGPLDGGLRKKRLAGARQSGSRSVSVSLESL